MSFTSQHLSTVIEQALSAVAAVATGANPATAVTEPAAGTDTLPLKGSAFNFISADNFAAWVGEQTHATVDIDGGTIDGAVIGGTTPAAGTFTTLGTTGAATFGGNVTANGNISVTTTSQILAANVFNVVGSSSDMTFNGGSLALNVIWNTGASTAEQMRLTSAGNLEMTAGGNITTTGTLSAGTTTVTGNVNVTGGYVYLDNNYSLQIRDTGGTHRNLIGVTSGDVIQLGNTAFDSLDLFVDGGKVLDLNSTAAIFSANLTANGTTFDLGDGGTNAVINFDATTSGILKLSNVDILTLATTGATIDGNLTISQNDQTNGSAISLRNTFDGGSWVAGDIIGEIGFYSADASGPGAGNKGLIQVTSGVSGNTPYGSMKFYVANTSNEVEALELRYDATGHFASDLTVAGTLSAGATTVSGELDVYDRANFRDPTNTYNTLQLRWTSGDARIGPSFFGGGTGAYANLRFYTSDADRGGISTAGAWDTNGGTLSAGATTITSTGNPNLNIVETGAGLGTQIRMANSSNATEVVMYADTNEDWHVYIDGADRLDVTSAGASITGALDVDLGAEGTYLTVGGDNASNARALTFTSATNTSVGAMHTINALSSNGRIKFAINSSDILDIQSSGASITGTLDAGVTTVGGTDSGSQLIVNRTGNGGIISYRRSDVQQGYMAVHSTNDESLTLYGTRHLLLSSDSGGGNAATIELTDSSTIEVTGDRFNVTSTAASAIIDMSGSSSILILDRSGTNKSSRVSFRTSDVEDWTLGVADTDDLGTGFIGDLYIGFSTSDAVVQIEAGSGNFNHLQGDATFAGDVTVGGNVTATKSGADGGLIITSADTSVGSTQQIGSITAVTVDTQVTTNDTVAQIDFMSDGSYTTDSAPGQIYFKTNDGVGTGALQTALTLDSSQNATFAGDVTLSQDKDATLQLRSTKNDASWTADVDTLGGIEFYSSDGSGSGIGVRAAIRSYATSATGSGGNLVFSTSADTTALTIDLSQNATFAGTLSASGQITSTGGNIVTQSGRFESVQGAGGIDTHFRASRGGTVWQLQTLTSDEFNLEVGGSDALTIDSSQNATFAGDVTVYSDDAIFTIQDTETASASAVATLRLAESGAGGSLGSYWDIQANAGSLHFIDQWNEGGGTGTRLTIDDSGNATFAGNVGIGTAPSRALHVDAGTTGPIADLQTSIAGLGYVNILNQAAVSTSNKVGFRYRLNTSTSERDAFGIQTAFTTTTDGSREATTEFLNGNSGGLSSFLTVAGLDATFAGTTTTFTGRIDVITAGTSSVLDLQGTSGLLILDRSGTNKQSQVVFQTGSVTDWRLGTADTDDLGAGFIGDFFIGFAHNDAVIQIEAGSGNFNHLQGNATFAGDVTLSAGSLSVTDSVNRIVEIVQSQSNANAELFFADGVGDRYRVGTTASGADFRIRDEQNARSVMEYDASLGEVEFGGYGVFTTVNDVPVRLVSTDSSVALRFTDSNGSTDIAYTGSNDLLSTASDLTLSAGDLTLSAGNVGIGTASPQARLHIVEDSTGDALFIETTESSSTAAPVICLKRHSSSPSDGDYLGQIKFLGENDADQQVMYAKITAKTSDVTDAVEDGLLEFAVKKAGSNSINARLTHSDLKLINGTGLEVDGALLIGTTSATSSALEKLRVVNSEFIHANFHRDSSSASMIQFTNDTTGTTSGDGFAIGIVSAEHAVLRNFEATDILIETNATERLRVASNAYAIGIGTADIETWDSSYTAIELGDGGAIMAGRAVSRGEMYLMGNAYYDGSNKYKNTNEASQFVIFDGYFSWDTAASGTADTAITFDTKMRLTNDGVLLVGDTANANMTVGLTINQGANDNEAFALKASSVAHGYISGAETDTYMSVQKFSGSGGGVKIRSLMEDIATTTTTVIESYGGTADTTKSASGRSLVEVFATEHDGANGLSSITADGNVFGVRARTGGTNSTLFLVDEDGDTWQSGGATFEGAVIMMASLPTSDPTNAGQLWNDSGTVKVSAG